jgi:hypothetical protein
MELIEKLDLMDKKIDRLLARGATSPEATPTPEGMVAVRPTGVHGAGKVRFWPIPATDGQITEGPWSYGQRMNKTLDAEGHPLYGPDGRYGIIGSTCSARGLTVPEACDFLMHPDDWYTQAEIDRAAMEAERDAGHGFSPGG